MSTAEAEHTCYMYITYMCGKKKTSKNYHHLGAYNMQMEDLIE